MRRRRKKTFFFLSVFKKFTFFFSWFFFKTLHVSGISAANAAINEMCFTDAGSKDLLADLGPGCDWYYVIKITTTLTTTNMKPQNTVFLQELVLGDTSSTAGITMLPT